MIASIYAGSRNFYRVHHAAFPGCLSTGNRAFPQFSSVFVADLSVFRGFYNFPARFTAFSAAR
jgi:hypothetical protein